MLTLGVFIPVSGWVADRFGARKVFAAAIAVFTIASLLCGLAGTLLTFVFVRILRGVGGAMMVPVGRLVVLRATPKEQLIRAIATLTWPALVAPVLGPPIGGLIADEGDWRWIFYLNLPLGLIAFVMALLLIPETKGEGKHPFDWGASCLSAARCSVCSMSPSCWGGGRLPGSRRALLQLSASVCWASPCAIRSDRRIGWSIFPRSGYRLSPPRSRAVRCFEWA
jgi:MFS family permease